MKQFIKIVSVSISIFLLVSASCSVAFASPEGNTFLMSCSKPSVSDHSGYVELVFRNDSTGYEFCNVVSWSFIPTLDSSNSVSDMPNVGLTRNSTSLKFFISSDSGVTGSFSIMRYDNFNQFYYGVYPVNSDQAQTAYQVDAGSGYSLVGAHYYGAYIPTSSLSNFTDVEFYVTYSEDSVVSWQLHEILNALSILVDNSGSDFEYNYDSVLNNIMMSLNNLEATSSTFRQDYLREVGKLLDLTEDVLSKIDITNEWLEQLFLFLETWVIDIDNWLQDLYWIELDSNGKLYEIKDTLDAILQLLQQKTDTEFTTVNQVDFNSYYDIENSLLSPDVDVSDVIGVEINQNAMTVIWDLVERGLQSHGKVFGMVLTILSLGIIALILGR